MLQAIHISCGRIFLAGILALGNSSLLAAPDCPVAAYAPKATNQIADWYEKFIAPSRAAGLLPAGPQPSSDQIEDTVDKLEAFHHRSVTEPLFFEALVQQISANFGKAANFRTLNSAAAEKIYQPGSGAGMDFSALCIDTRTARFPDDTFTITLFGVNSAACQRVGAGLRGLVFTATRINGAGNAECRPDHIYYKHLIVPVRAGTNFITFLCSKDAGGCAGR